MNPYVTFRDADKEGELQYYILQRTYPHYLGRIDYFPSMDPLCQVPISGHHLYVSFCGVLRGNYVPAQKGVETEILAVLEDMALWFYSNRIVNEPKKYKKWAI